jgi:hypothetical protein
LLSIPIAIIDSLLLGRSSGGWISLDLTGLLIGAYLLFLVTHIAVSTAAVFLFPNAGMWTIHLPSALLAVFLLSAGIYTYTEIQDKASASRYEEEREKSMLFKNVISLDSWKFSPNPDSATNLSISVTVSESGRFAVGATGRDEGDYGEWYFQSENEEQRMVDKGEHFDFNIPLKRERYGVPKNIEITLYLFSDTTGSAGRDVIKVFQSAPVERELDGDYFRAPLPKPRK